MSWKNYLWRHYLLWSSILLMEGRTHTANYVIYYQEKKWSLLETWFVLFYEIMVNLWAFLFLSLPWLLGSSAPYFMAHYSNNITRVVDIWLLNPSRLQPPSGQHRARRRARTHKLRDHDLSRSQTLNQLSHPGTPVPRWFWHSIVSSLELYLSLRPWWPTLSQVYGRCSINVFLNWKEHEGCEERDHFCTEQSLAGSRCPWGLN